MITVKKDAIKYKSSDGTMKDSGVLCQVGTFGVDWFQYAVTLANVFKEVTFPEDNKGLEFYLPNVTTLEKTFNSVKNAKKIKLKNDIQKEIALNLAFSYSDVEILDLSEFNCLIKNFASVFLGCYSIKEIIGILDVTKATSMGNAFTSCNKLIEIRFAPNCISLSTAFLYSKYLSDESIQSIIDGLAEVETSQTITFHVDVKAKLTEEQIATITSKNWTLA